MLCIGSRGGEKILKEIGRSVAAGTFLPPEMTPEVEKKLKGIDENYGQKLYPPDYLD